MEVRVVSKANEIVLLLQKFDNVVPRFRERVQDYKAYAQKLSENALVFECRENEEPVGFAAVYANNLQDETAFLALLAILPQYQGKQLGKRLMESCCIEAKKNGMKRIRLEVDISNHKAIGFYTRRGFASTNEYTTTSMYMEKKL